MPLFYEFFAGGGMARAGLGPSWTCLRANDVDPKKASAYVANWGAKEFILGDVAQLKISQLPGKADLAWASFPCQDLSLAGGQAGLRGERSGTFWPFWNLIRSLKADARAPQVVVLENVCGVLTSHGGDDFVALSNAMAEVGYTFGAIVINAVDFVPQSRPRLFMVAARMEVGNPLKARGPSYHWHPASLRAAQERLVGAAADKWVWWNLPAPPKRNQSFLDLIEDVPSDVSWHTRQETSRLLAMMSPRNLEKLRLAKLTNQRMVGGVYKRTRMDQDGHKTQRAEVRFDDISGCLRTPSGGSSRQTIILVEGGRVRSRLLSSREAARLMGLPKNYILPDNYNEAYHLAGDGVVVPVVRFLADKLIEPLLGLGSGDNRKKAA